MLFNDGGLSIEGGERQSVELVEMGGLPLSPLVNGQRGYFCHHHKHHHFFHFYSASTKMLAIGRVSIGLRSSPPTLSLTTTWLSCQVKNNNKPTQRSGSVCNSVNREKETK